jgi:hypothetical protein
MTVRIPIISTFNAKGIKDATKQFNKLGHSVNGALKIAAVEEFARRSIKAFAENQKGVALLTNTLKNLGQEFMAVGVVKFIDDLTLATGKTKEELIPAFQGLFIATGSVTKAQEALKLAMDVSAGTTKDLNTVQIALSKAYLGNTTSLTRLGAGLSKTLLKTGNMEKITAQLAATFKGNASIAADTFTGKMDRLKASINDAQEIIGGAMVNSLAKFAGTNGVGGAQKAVKGLGDEIGYIVTGIGDMAAAIKPLLPLLTAVGLAMLAISNPFTAGAIGIALVAGEAAKIKDRNYYAAKKTVSYGGGRGAGGYTTGLGHTRTPMQSPGDRAKIDAGNAKLAKAKKDELAMLTAKNKLTLAEATAKADQAKLDEQKKKFDLERIGIAAGIAQKEDELSKTKDAAGRALLTVELDRLKLQQAILDENAKLATSAADALAKAEADKLRYEIAAADALAKLALNSGLAQIALGKLAGFTMPGQYASSGFPGSDADIAAKAAAAAAAAAKAAADAAALLAGTNAAAALAAAQAKAAADAAIALGKSQAEIAALIKAAADAAAALATLTAKNAADKLAADAAAAAAAAAGASAGAGAAAGAGAGAGGSTGGGYMGDNSLKPGDFGTPSYDPIPLTTFSELDIAALNEFIAAANAFANKKDAGVEITINDNTSGLIAVVANAVIDNNRYGNSLVPTGTIAG